MNVQETRQDAEKPFFISCDEWLGRPDDGAAAATFGAIRVVLNGRVVTRVEDVLARSVRDRIYVSSGPMAQWFLWNYFRLLYDCEPPKPDPDWWMAHRLSAAGGGYSWPNIEFFPDLEGVLIVAHGDPESVVGTVRYITESASYLPLEEFRNAIAAFIEEVIGRIHATLCKDDLGLEALWKEIQKDLRDDERLLERRLQASLGLDLDEEVPRSIREIWGSRGTELGFSSLGEVFQAFRRDLTAIERVLEQRKGAEGWQIEVPQADVLSGLLKDLMGEARPWRRGERLANEARKIWGVGQSEPVSDETLGRIFGFHKAAIEASDTIEDSGASSAWRIGGDGRLGVVVTKKVRTQRRFMLMRLVADFITSKDGVLWPATDAKTARQKFQRAFASQFLCPWQEVVASIGLDPHSIETSGGISPSIYAVNIDDSLLDDIAAHFDVSPLLVRTVLVNKGILPRSEIL